MARSPLPPPSRSSERVKKAKRAESGQRMHCEEHTGAPTGSTGRGRGRDTYTAARCHTALIRTRDGYCALKPSRHNSRMGSMWSHTIHQMTTLHSAEVSTARGHLERGEGGKDTVQIGKPKSAPHTIPQQAAGEHPSPPRPGAAGVKVQGAGSEQRAASAGTQRLSSISI